MLVQEGACPAFAWKKAIWRDPLSIQNEAISLVAIRSKELIDWSRHCQTWLERRPPLKENLQRKQNWTAKSTNLKENAGKIKSVFLIGAVLRAEKLGRCLENYRSWKNTRLLAFKSFNLESSISFLTSIIQAKSHFAIFQVLLFLRATCSSEYGTVWTITQCCSICILLEVS